MKIVYLAPCRTPFPSRHASSIHMIRICEALAGLGHEVTLVASDQGASADDILDFFGVATRYPIRHIRVPASRLGNILYAFRAGRVARELGADLVLGRSASACAVACLGGARTVFDAHGPIWETNPFERLAFALMARSSNLVRMTVNSGALKKIYEEHGAAPPCGIVTAHNGAQAFDPEGQAPLPSWPGRPGTLQVGYVGHLYRGRGIDIIVKCAEALPECDFHIIGGTDEDIQAWQAQAPLGNIFFHGFVKPSEVPRYRHRCDVLLAPYQRTGVGVAGGGGDSSAYMNPIKIVEYMSSGKAIVCSDLPILKEVLGNDAALFVPPADRQAWIAAIRQLALPATREEYAARVRARFSGNLTWEARARRMLGQA